MLAALKWSAAALGLIVFSCRTPIGPGEPSSVFLITTTDSDLAFCVSETNRYRAMAGRSSLTRSSSLEDRARLAAESDHQTGQPHGYFTSHPLALGAENEVIRWSLAAHGSTRDVMTAAIASYWQEGTDGGHYRNIAGAHTAIGCGVVNSGGFVTFVQDFQ